MLFRSRRPLVEQLESRRLLASDLGFVGVEPLAGESAQQQQLVGEGEASGEDAADLVAFANAVAESGAMLYCGNWWDTCTAQKELFEDGGEYLPYVEVTNPDRTINQAGIDNEITTIPTWDFPNGSRILGALSLDEIAAQLEIDIPQSSVPSLAAIPDQTLLFGSPLHIPLNAYDPNGDALSVSIEVADPTLLDASLITGNRSLELDIEGYGSMVFELFEQRASRPTSRIIELAQADFFDGIGFHRILEGFVIQGGDPTGTGRGGSTLGNFDDQYHVELQHNTPGVLSYAKSSDDTNDSQFFITDGPLRFLDFEHSVFGTLVEGESVRAAIDLIPTDGLGRPSLFPVTIEDARVFSDNENSLIMLKPKQDAGATDVTVVMEDAAGNRAEQTFRVTLGADTFNGAPFLEPIPISGSCTNSIHEMQVFAQDKEGDEIVFELEALGSDLPDGFSIDVSTGEISVSHNANFSGEYFFRATVSQTVETDTNSGVDNQVFSILISDDVYQNPENALDVNGDNFLSPIDALIVINELNQNGSLGGSPPLGSPYLDASGDCSLSPIDALLIVNELNSNGSGEGESSSVAEPQQADLASKLEFSLWFPGFRTSVKAELHTDEHSASFDFVHSEQPVSSLQQAAKPYHPSTTKSDSKQLLHDEEVSDTSIDLALAELPLILLNPKA